MRKIAGILICTLGLLAVLAYAKSQGVRCPICNSESCYFTGKTKIDSSGAVLQKYQCAASAEHKFWFRDKSEAKDGARKSSKDTKGVECPICQNGSCYFTGETKTDAGGALLRAYQCVVFASHKFWIAAE